MKRVEFVCEGSVKEIMLVLIKLEIADLFITDLDHNFGIKEPKDEFGNV